MKPSPYILNPSENHWVKLTPEEFNALKIGDPVVVNYDFLMDGEPTVREHLILGTYNGFAAGWHYLQSPVFYDKRWPRGGGYYSYHFGKLVLPKREEIHEMIAYDS